ncbi:MAG: hypothetical protein KDB27_06180 [Planctomycetales bacterium]|nr:hypothetical protein [Planctomycetales bacterium]
MATTNRGEERRWNTPGSNVRANAVHESARAVKPDDNPRYRIFETETDCCKETAHSSRDEGSEFFSNLRHTDSPRNPMRGRKSFRHMNVAAVDSGKIEPGVSIYRPNWPDNDDSLRTAANVSLPQHKQHCNSGSEHD